MKIIYDEMYPEEFFRYGGKVLVGSFEFEIDTYGKWKKIVNSPNWNFELINNYGGDAWIGDMHFSYDKENGWFKYKGNLPKIDTNDPYGVPNTNFSLIDDQDARWEEYSKQRKDRGFDDSEIWNLDITIAKFILPRLERYQEIKVAHPGNMTEEQWNKNVALMISAFKTYLYDTDLINDEDIIKKFCNQRIIDMDVDKALKIHKEYMKGMELFNKYWCWLGD